MRRLKIIDIFRVISPALLLALAVAAAVASGLQCGPPYICTFDDLNASGKVQKWVMEDIQRKGMSLNEEMEIILYFDHRVNASEIADIEEVVVLFREESAYPTGWEPVWLYSARCVIENICKLIDMDLVLQIGSGEGEPSLPLP